jgi:hypothetical protein
VREGSKLSKKNARIAKVAELSATLAEITIPSVQADPLAALAGVDSGLRDEPVLPVDVGAVYESGPVPGQRRAGGSGELE